MKPNGWGCAAFALLILPAFAQPSVATIQVDASQRFQFIDGFGVNFNGTYFRDAQKPMIDMLIDDLGATIFRLDPYGLINWEAKNDNDDPRVANWEYYNDRFSTPVFEAAWAAGRYLNSRGIHPLLALSGIPPDWMLDNAAGPPKHKVCKGDAKPAGPDHLDPAMYDEFAETVVTLAAYARNKARLQFELFGPLNETDCYPAEGPRIDPEEMPSVLAAVVRRMKKEGLGDLKLVVAEQAILQNNYEGPILEHAELMRQVGAFAFHTYGGESLAPHVERVRKSKYQDVPVWLTEYGDLSDLDRTDDNEWTSFSIAASKRVLRALNDGASAALFWDAYDNYHEHYPRFTYYGLVRNADHLYAPKKRYFAAKQLYRFVRPGAQRIAATADAPGLTVAAFRHSGSVTVVGVKERGADRVRIVMPGVTSWDLYQTTRRLNCSQTDKLVSKDGAVEFDLPGDAIFTLVGMVQ